MRCGAGWTGGQRVCRSVLFDVGAGVIVMVLLHIAIIMCRVLYLEVIRDTSSGLN